MKTYLVTPVGKSTPHEIEADRVRKDEASGAVLFEDANGNLLAQEYNVSFRLKPADAE